MVRYIGEQGSACSIKWSAVRDIATIVEIESLHVESVYLASVRWSLMMKAKRTNQPMDPESCWT